MPQSKESRVLDAVEAIYAAALTPEEWPNALNMVAAVLDDTGALLIYQRDDGGFGTLVSPGLQQAQRAYVDGGWWQHDIRMQRGIALTYSIDIPRAVTERDLFTQAEMVEHPFYRDFVLPQGLGWFAGVSISPDPRVIAALSLQRPRSRKPYSDKELGLVYRLATHVEAALRLSIRLLNAEAANQALGDALMHLGVGVFLVDSLNRIVFSNRAAAELIEAGVIRAGHIGLADPARDHAFQAAYRDARARGRLNPALPILIPRSDKGSVLAMHVFPVRIHALYSIESLLADVSSVVVVSEAGDREFDPAVVRDLLGVTLGEARVAALVGGGLRPADAAERLGISIETARTVLKRVFAKTGLARQSELSGLLSRLLLH